MSESDIKCSICVLTLLPEQVNAAKGRLKTILHRDLYEPIDDLLKYATCPQKKAVLFDYEQALSRTGAWPVEKSFQSMSVRRMLTALGRFNGTNTHASNHCSDHRSSFLYKPTVDDAVRTTRIYFDGLCLGKFCFSSLRRRVANLAHRLYEEVQVR